MPSPSSESPATTTETTIHFGKPAAAALALVVITVVVYMSALRGGFIWDDDAYVTRNMTLRTADGLWRIWTDVHASPQYYPLTLTSFWIEYQLWGLWPAGYHAVNVLLHAGSSVVLWRILRRLSVPGAWLAAAIFAIHPVHVESVEWITERKNVLSGFFYLLAAWAYLKSEGIGDRDDAPDRDTYPWLWYAAAVALFACALLSKTVTSTLPAAILLVLWWKRGRVTGAQLVRLVPLLVIGAAMGLVTAWLEKQHVGAQGDDFDLGGLERILVAGRAVWFYAWKLVWPTDLSFIYPRWDLDVRSWWQWLFPAGFVVVVVVLWAWRERSGRGPLTAVLFFAGTLFPALGFVNVYPMRFSFVADHFQYLASIGLIALAAAGLARLRGTRAIGAVVLLVLGVLAWRQAEAYASPESLWTTVIRRNPAAWMARTNYGVLLLDQAQAKLMRSGGRADVQATLAAAEEQFRETISLVPDHLEPRLNLARVAELAGDYATAERRLRAAIELHPHDGEPHFHLGRVLAAAGRTDEAVAAYRRAIELSPEREPAYVNLGALLADQGKPAEAEPYYRQALRLEPDSIFARTNLGNALMQLGRHAEAAEEYRRVLQLEPDFPPALGGLAEAERLMASTPRPE